MDLILLSGGSGKRLWPLSNDSRSKQFLRVLENNNKLESMVQRVWGQLKKLQLNESTVIATSKSQVDMIHSQLGNHIPLIIEPERRDTFPAIALAATYLYSVKGSCLNEVVGVLPVDPYVEISFFERIKDLEGALNTSKADLALMGVNPTFPSEKYGYIVPVQNNGDDYIQVSHFKEKPSEMEARELMQQNALWNCGVFAFKLEYIISLLEAKGLPTQYEELMKQYQSLEKISFDYAVVEKTEKIVALPYSGSWKDLGTWNTLTEEMGTKQIGKGIISNDSTNTHLVNELDIPITVLGIKDAVVAASPDGILVTDKVASPRIKEVLKGFEQRPMYEERRWGWYRVLDHTKFEEGNEVLTKRIGVNAGKNLSYQKHYARSEVWTIIKGEGEFALNDEIREVKPGDVLVIPVEAKHGIKATTDLEFIEVQTGSQLIEEDIVRIYMTWEEVEEHCKSLVK
ncbi:mannose-1-phosphate guanylyltransferase [Cytobacillus firmus]|uniref:sugar phosphate nucleotidyltransferase n=1 Tax=Cytobacillus firmus TaxID=1399 RepID=UPI0018CD9B73|nr:sugar phosphate nucleotidyltransferase [Cytobacillus firmus]MBG9544617.1 mannose-1-phosphate guanylyltransferase [Cytobacillus firmus]MBG9553687.1 mannose-1-phosphate guanylyltransferase [Cytobacillus firmus]MBG9575161.1 mannose-1-phosphate guanylyltransferase [Cytobacillus firmus]MED4447560.1 sugar phosphate nucleotidyltransferase [Cytobacillus firmus]MED4769679.1 sugar phosphate nucleotidyltransferase [Cytobacillus firmus]